MDAGKTVAFLVFVLFGLSALYQRRACHLGDNQVQLMIDASPKSERKIPDTLFGIFFEEINHAGAGGLWAELVSNRGFEAGGPNTPSNIDPWSIIGTESNIVVSTDRSSCFDRNKVALRMDVLCDGRSSILCPPAGVGVYNPGFWGMNIESGKEYKVSLYVRSLQPINISVSLASSEGSQILASFNVVDDTLPNWTKKEFVLKSQGSNYNSRLQLTTTVKGVIWLDQVSVMPADTYKGHGFRNDLFSMVANMRPRFLRFPGGCFVEGEWLRNAFRWRESIGPWEERPGHFGDVWMYWTDDGLGYFEFLQLSEDLGAAPIWVVNNGISHTDQVATSSILPFVQDTLDSIEFARGDPNSTWGSVRAAMGHPEPFPLKYVAVGNEDCGKTYYRGNYVKFYNAIKNAYPDICIISNCDGSSRPLDHPADLYDFHVYTSANSLFSMSHQFDKAARTGPKAFVSEYAVTGNDAGTGSFLAALAEAGFLIGLETNSDVVGMISYAPLFVNANNRRWNPDAIVFNASHVYGTPSYWVQQFFKDSSGSILHPVALAGNATKSLMASALTWTRPEDGLSFLKIKIVNYGSESIQLVISISGLESVISQSGSKKTVFTSENLMAENSFQQPNKVVPLPNPLPNAASNMNIIISPKSVTSFDLALAPGVYRSSI